MKNLVINSKEFTANVKGANQELNGIFKSPFVVVNLLEKAAKGDFSKVANFDGIKPENVAKVAKALKQVTGNKKAFALDIFAKDSKGRFCFGYTKTDISGIEISDVINGHITFDNKGREVFVRYDKDNNPEYMAFKPIPCTIIGVFNAFSNYAKVDIRDTEKAAKAFARESKKAAKAAKAFEKAKKAVFAVFGEFANTFDNNTIMEKYQAIKAA